MSQDRAIRRRASSFFGYAFVWSAALNVLPQVYLLEVAPARKGLLLSSLLLVGTVAAWIGVSLSRRQLVRGRGLGRVKLVVTTLGFGLPLIAIIAGVRPLLAYAALFVVFRGLSNWVFNHVDNAIVRRAGRAGTSTHSSSAVGFQVLGHMAGPVVFALLASRVGLCVALTIAALAWATWAVHDAFDDAPAPRSVVVGERRLSSAGWWFLAHCLLVQTGIIGMFAQLIFLLGDWMLLDDPRQMGGVLITGAGLTSVLTVVASSRLGARGSGCPRRGLIVAALLAASSTMVLALRLPAWGLVLVALLAGMGGGRYMLISRTIASSWTGAVGREGMLSRYNNITNVASVVAFLALVGLAAGLGEHSPAYNPALLGLFLALFLLAALSLVFVPRGLGSGTSEALAP